MSNRKKKTKCNNKNDDSDDELIDIVNDTNFYLNNNINSKSIKEIRQIEHFGKSDTNKSSFSCAVKKPFWPDVLWHGGTLIYSMRQPDKCLGAPVLKTDKTLRFNSKFESGNLMYAYRINPDSYHLILEYDHTPAGGCQWFYFQMSNIKKERKVTFYISGFNKNSGVFSNGSKVFMYSEKLAQLKSISWFRAGNNYAYGTTLKNKHNKRSTLQFQILFPYDDDVCYLAYALPYTYTDLNKYIEKWQSAAPDLFESKTLCKTLGGRCCPLLTITSSHPKILSKKNTQNNPQDNKNLAKCSATRGDSNGSQINNPTINHDDISLNQNINKNYDDDLSTLNITNSRKADMNDKNDFNNIRTNLKKHIDDVIDNGNDFALNEDIFRNDNNDNNNYTNKTNLQNTTTTVTSIKKRCIFVTARIHPGESNGSIVLHGLIDFLLSGQPTATYLLDHFIFKIVPMINIDGVVEGFYRTGIEGDDLNRVWSDPDPFKHPVVYETKRLLHQISKEMGISAYLDFHGHSRQHGTFAYGCPSEDESARISNNNNNNNNYNNNNNNNNNSKEKVFPKMLAYLCDAFSWAKCVFSLPQARKDASRCVINRELGVINSFTIESSFGGILAGPRANSLYNEEIWKEIGGKVGEALFHLLSIEPSPLIKLIESNGCIQSSLISNSNKISNNSNNKDNKDNKDNNNNDVACKANKTASCYCSSTGNNKCIVNNLPVKSARAANGGNGSMSSAQARKSIAQKNSNVNNEINLNLNQHLKLQQLSKVAKMKNGTATSAVSGLAQTQRTTSKFRKESAKNGRSTKCKSITRNVK